MSAEDWYRRHFGAGSGTPPPSPQPGPASASPYHYPQAQAAAPVQPQQYVPQDATAQVLASIGVGSQGRNVWAPPPPNPVDTSRIPKGAVNPENFLTLAQYWRGADGQREAMPCPKCNGILFRRFEGSREARPLCTECGYNGSFVPGEFAAARV